MLTFMQKLIAVGQKTPTLSSPSTLSMWAKEKHDENMTRQRHELMLSIPDTLCTASLAAYSHLPINDALPLLARAWAYVNAKPELSVYSGNMHFTTSVFKPHLSWGTYKALMHIMANVDSKNIPPHIRALIQKSIEGQAAAVNPDGDHENMVLYLQSAKKILEKMQLRALSDDKFLATLVKLSSQSPQEMKPDDNIVDHVKAVFMHRFYSISAELLFGRNATVDSARKRLVENLLLNTLNPHDIIHPQASFLTALVEYYALRSLLANLPPRQASPLPEVFALSIAMHEVPNARDKLEALYRLMTPGKLQQLATQIKTHPYLLGVDTSHTAAAAAQIPSFT